MDRRKLLVLLGLVVLGAFFSYLLRNVRPVGQHAGMSPAALAVFSDDRSPSAAPANSSLTVVVFADYQCPACRKAHPALHAAVEEDGAVRIVYKDWPIFGERSLRAAKVALTSDLQGIYPAVHHQLMTSQWDDGAMRTAIEQSGGDWHQLRADLLKHRSAIDEQLAANRREAFALGLAGTPGYLIGPILIKGALTEREFLRAFAQARSELEAHSAEPAPSPQAVLPLNVVGHLIKLNGPRRADVEGILLDLNGGSAPLSPSSGRLLVKLERQGDGATKWIADCSARANG